MWPVIIREEGLMHVWGLEMRLWAQEGRGLDHRCMPKEKSRGYAPEKTQTRMKLPTSRGR